MLMTSGKRYNPRPSFLGDANTELFARCGARTEGDGFVADVQPFRGLRYSLKADEVASVVAPPYDVLDKEARQKLLAGDGRNIVAVDLAEDGYAEAAQRWQDWQRQGIVAPEQQPALYAYKQTFVALDGQTTERIGVMGAVKLAPYEERVVFPHERTLTGPKADRLELMRA